MASLDKLVKAVESLKLVQNATSASSGSSGSNAASVVLDGSMTRQEKMSHCVNVADGICAQAAQPKTSPSELAKFLSVTFETFFLLMDDPDIDVRTVADENLNKIIKSLMDSHCGRLQVELFKEIKKNGSARSLKAALLKFSELSPHIRQQKYRAYVTNLLPCFVSIVRRQEETIHEALAASIPKIFRTLGNYATESEIRMLLKTFTANLFDSNPVIRRTTAISISVVCEKSGRPELFLPWLLSTLLDFLIPIQTSEETPANRILGILTSIRQLLPLLVELKISYENNDFLERLLQLYEISLHYIAHQNHMITTCALETLQILLQNPHPMLKDCLISPSGIRRSRIFSQNVGSVSAANLSRMNSLMMNEEEESLLDLEPSVSESSNIVSARMVLEGTVDEDPNEPMNEPESKEREKCETPKEVEVTKIRETGDLLPIKDDQEKKNLPPEEFKQSKRPIGAQVEKENIGHFCDTDIPLIYCARKITVTFLLTKEKGCLKPDSVSRVSIKMLAFGCLTSIVRLCPKVFLLTLFYDQEEEDPATPLIRDVTNYYDMSHHDPQLRGCVAVLLGTLLRGALIEGGGNLELWFNQRRPDHEDISNILKSMFEDESSITLKMVLSSSKMFLRRMLLTSHSCHSAIGLLERMLLVANSKYWLVKQELCELLSTVPGAAIFALTKNNDLIVKIQNTVLNFLKESDQRVRTSAAKAFVKLIDTLYFPEDDMNNDAVVASAIEMSENLVNPISGKRDDWIAGYCEGSNAVILRLIGKGCNHPEDVGQTRRQKISRAVYILRTQLYAARSHFHISGIIETLKLLCDLYSPSEFPISWGSQGSKLTPQLAGKVSERNSTSQAYDLLNHLITMISKNASLATDITTHAKILSICARLFMSLILERQKMSMIPSQNTSERNISNDNFLERSGTMILQHSCKLFAVISAVLDDLPITNQTLLRTTSISSSNSAISPVKKKPDFIISGDKKETAPNLESSNSPSLEFISSNKIGQFSHSTHYMKTYEMIKTMFSLHKTSADSKHIEKLRDLLRSALNAVSIIFELARENCIGKATEEFLGYVKTNLVLEPNASLICVQSLLRCIFKMNFTHQSKDHMPNSPSTSTNPGFYSALPPNQGMFSPCFDIPYNELVHAHNLARDALSVIDPSTALSKFEQGKRLGTLKAPAKSSADRNSLASYIKLFEPTVIKALKHYTLTSEIIEQKRVLQLLVQLVQLRVNYCLLDSDKIFIGFILKQLEQIEEGHFMNADELLPDIFRFLILLSYEKHHSKPIIDVTRVIALCERLFNASLYRQTALALGPVAEDLFCMRNAILTSVNGSSNDIETHRDRVIELLLKLLEHSEAMTTLVMILKSIKTENEEKWRKLSRLIVDILLPFLANHKIKLSDKQSLDLVLRVFTSLAPGSLRPVDPLLMSVLTSAVDFSNIEEIQRWLGFIIVALPILTNQSPEEGILCRLEELGIQSGTGSTPPKALDTSVESSTSTSSDAFGFSCGSTSSTSQVKPEVTLAKFLIHVLGASSSKLSHLIFSQTYETEDCFLKQEISRFLLFVIYMFQSGRYARVWHAFIGLAKETEDTADLLYTVDNVTEIFLQISHEVPYLALQWLFLLNILDHCHQGIWPKVLTRSSETNDIEQDAGLHLEILRTGGFILCCDFLCEHIDNVDSTTWLIVNHIQLLVENNRESPVQEFVLSMHRSQSSSGLLLQAIVAKCEFSADVRFLRETLIVIENAHIQHVGKLLVLLVRKFLRSPFLTLARESNRIACSRIQAIIKDHKGEIKEILHENELSELLDLMRSPKLSRRYARLVSLLNSISHQFYELSPIEGDELRMFNSGSIANLNVDKDWFLSQLRQKCCGQQLKPDVWASLLANLEYEEIVDILQRKEFKLDVLSHCIDFKQNNLFRATKDTLMHHLNALVEALPKPIQIFHPDDKAPTQTEIKYSNKLSITFESDEFRGTLIQLLKITCALLHQESLSLNGVVQESSRERNLARFGILSLEYVKWLVLNKDNKIVGFEDHFVSATKAANVILSNTQSRSILLLGENHDLLISAVFSLHSVFTSFIGMQMMNQHFPECFKSLLIDSDQSEISYAVMGCLKLNEMLTFCLDHKEQFKAIAKDLASDIEDLVLGLCRMPLFSSYVRIPPHVWKLGWEVNTFGPRQTYFPILPVFMLQEIDILQEYVRRANHIGFISKQQFEEIWVSCQSVFSVSREDLTEAEIKALGHCLAFVVQALTSLLLMTTFLPYPGQTNKSSPIHYARDNPSQFLLSPRGQQLTSIQNFIQSYLERNCSEKQFLQVDCSLNLERCVALKRKKIGFSQVGIGYIMNAIRHSEENLSQEIADTKSNKSQALSLPFLLREESLHTLGIDMPSCLQFLFDLYTDLLSDMTQINLVTETIRSILMLSDLFSESSSFAWMYDQFCEALKQSPVEDEILSGLLTLGLCKALSVIGGDQESIDRARKTIETSLRSNKLPTRICALQAILYLLQSESIANDNLACILPVASDYLQTYLQDSDQSEEHLAVMWSLAFYTLENFELESLSRSSDWANHLVQLAISIAGQLSTPPGIYLLVLSGLERLIVSGKLSRRLLEQVMKLATDLMTEPNPALTLPAIQLFLAGMYCSTSASQISIDTPSGGIEDPERLMQAMEQMSILFDCVRRSGPSEAKLLCELLPRVLVDFFPAADVINRVISTFISPGQPHQVLLSGVLFAVFRQASVQNQTDMLQDWVLMALPNFTRRDSLSHSVWCLSCFFIAASSHNPWLQAYFPYLQQRFGLLQHEDKKLFCLAAREFYFHLRDDDQKSKFKETFQAVAQPNTPYFYLLQALRSS